METAFNAQLEPVRKTLVDSFAPLYENAENGESAGKRTERLRNFPYAAARTGENG